MTSASSSRGRSFPAVEAGNQPDLHSFANGLKRDHDIVLNGLTMAWNSGVVEATSTGSF
jgi:transposase